MQTDLAKAITFAKRLMCFVMAQIQMKNTTEFELAELNGNNGALLVLEDGLYFQEYLPAKDVFSYFGDSVAIDATGAFGAFNLMKKMEESETPSPREVARALRNEFTLRELTDKKLLTHFPWCEVEGAKNRTFMGTVEVRLKQGYVIKLSGPEERAEAYTLISNKLNEP